MTNHMQYFGVPVLPTPEKSAHVFNNKEKKGTEKVFKNKYKQNIL